MYKCEIHHSTEWVSCFSYQCFWTQHVMVCPSLLGPEQRGPPCPGWRGVRHAVTVSRKKEKKKRYSKFGQIPENGQGLALQLTFHIVAHMFRWCVKHIPWLVIWDSGSVRRKRCDAERSSRILYPSPPGQRSCSPTATPVGPSFPERLPGAGRCDRKHPARWPHCGSVTSRRPAAAPQSRR